MFGALFTDRAQPQPLPDSNFNTKIKRVGNYVRNIVGHMLFTVGTTNN